MIDFKSCASSAVAHHAWLPFNIGFLVFFQVFIRVRRGLYVGL